MVLLESAPLPPSSWIRRSLLSLGVVGFQHGVGSLARFPLTADATLVSVEMRNLTPRGTTSRHEEATPRGWKRSEGSEGCLFKLRPNYCSLPKNESCENISSII